MPLYEYKCQKCKHKFTEFFHKIDASPAVMKCEKENCDGEALKIISLSDFKFLVSPTSGHYFPTIGKTCYSESEFLNNAEKVKSKMRKEANRRNENKD